MIHRKSSVQINTIERVDLHIPLHPYHIDILEHYLEEISSEKQNMSWATTSGLKIPSDKEYQEPKTLRIVDSISKIISIISGIAVIVFVALLITGKEIIGDFNIDTLLTIFSFTLIGGFISIGGVKMFSITASLRKAKERIDRVITKETGCPFLPLFSGEKSDLRRPGNPNFCVKCPLGIDRDSSSNVHLIHVCKVYPSLHEQWKIIPGASQILHR